MGTPTAAGREPPPFLVGKREPEAPLLGLAWPEPGEDGDEEEDEEEGDEDDDEEDDEVSPGLGAGPSVQPFPL